MPYTCNAPLLTAAYPRDFARKSPKISTATTIATSISSAHNTWWSCCTHHAQRAPPICLCIARRYTRAAEVCLCVRYVHIFLEYIRPRQARYESDEHGAYTRRNAAGRNDTYAHKSTRMQHAFRCSGTGEVLFLTFALFVVVVFVGVLQLCWSVCCKRRLHYFASDGLVDLRVRVCVSLLRLYFFDVGRVKATYIHTQTLYADVSAGGVSVSLGSRGSRADAVLR